MKNGVYLWTADVKGRLQKPLNQAFLRILGPDLKSAIRKDVWVQIPPRAPSYCWLSAVSLFLAVPAVGCVSPDVSPDAPSRFHYEVESNHVMQ